MKNLKLLGLAVSVVVVMTATAGSASANSTLCKVSGAPCPEASRYVAGNHLTGTAGVNRITASPEVICQKSTMTLQITSSEGTGDVTALTFSDCKTGSTNCTLTAEGLPYHATFDVNGTGPNGTLTVDGPVITADCAGFLNCKFSNNSSALPVTGGSTATITAPALAFGAIAGFLCPSSAKWDATYSVPNLWVRPLP